MAEARRALVLNESLLLFASARTETTARDLLSALLASPSPSDALSQVLTSSFASQIVLSLHLFTSPTAQNHVFPGPHRR